MELKDLTKRAMAIADKYDDLNQTQRGIEWNQQQLMAGLVGDIGDLSKIIMAKDGFRAMANVDQKLAHELSDCLWSILVLANKYNIDLESAFMTTMKELDSKIDGQLHGSL